MLESVLEQVKTNILTLNPKTFQKGYAGARQYQDGKIVIYDNSEGTYAGLKDTEYNYFYIRYLGNIPIDIAPEDSRTTSCNELEGVAELRLVAWVHKGDFSKLVEVLLNDITSTDFSQMSATAREKFSGYPKIGFNLIEADPEQIYKDETGDTEENKVRLAKDVTLVAIDFSITFTYKMKADACIDRNICVGCTE